MESLEKQIIDKQATIIGQLTTTVTELDIKLLQALQTINAMEKELNRDGDIQQNQQDDAGREVSDAERVQQV